MRSHRVCLQGLLSVVCSCPLGDGEESFIGNGDGRRMDKVLSEVISQMTRQNWRNTVETLQQMSFKGDTDLGSHKKSGD